MKNNVPGYIGVAPFRNRDLQYSEFLNELQSWQAARRKPVTTELPSFARETVDSIRALTTALATSSNKRDGSSVVRELRKLEFDGVSGRVAFTDSGDRKNPQYSIFNAQSVSADGILSWKEIGSTGTEVGSVSLTNGLQDVCFAESGCDLDEPPRDTYPVPPLPVPVWTIVVIATIAILLVALAIRYRRSSGRKRVIREELEALQQSVAGMRTAEKNYIPMVAKKQDGDIEQALDKKSGRTAVETAQWMWQETTGYMDKHDTSQIYGDPSDCWILYSDKSTAKLEEAYKRRKAKVSPLPGYEVIFASMIQTKLATGFTRQVKRMLEDESK